LSCETPANAGWHSGYFQGRRCRLRALHAGWIGGLCLNARSLELAWDENSNSIYSTTIFWSRGLPDAWNMPRKSCGGMKRKRACSAGMNIPKSYLIAKSFPLAIWWDALYRQVFLLVISFPIGKKVPFWLCNLFEDSCPGGKHESSNKTLSQAQLCSGIGVNYHSRQCLYGDERKFKILTFNHRRDISTDERSLL